MRYIGDISGELAGKLLVSDEKWWSTDAQLESGLWHELKELTPILNELEDELERFLV